MSWNVFVVIARLGEPSAAFQQLTGHEVEGEPELYLWGDPDLEWGASRLAEVA